MKSEPHKDISQQIKISGYINSLLFQACLYFIIFAAKRKTVRIVQYVFLTYIMYM
jgi:hypothetical protein